MFTRKLQVTSPWAYTFIVIHHNISTATTDDLTLPQKYTTGWKDACAVFFYFLITIIVHAVFQEYIFDVSIHLSNLLYIEKDFYIIKCYSIPCRKYQNVFI